MTKYRISKVQKSGWIIFAILSSFCSCLGFIQMSTGSNSLNKILLDLSHNSMMQNDNEDDYSEFFNYLNSYCDNNIDSSLSSEILTSYSSVIIPNSKQATFLPSIGTIKIFEHF